jgi:hypothetical protein
MWWGGHVLEECSSDLNRALDRIITMIDAFLGSEGAAFARSSKR